MFKRIWLLENSIKLKNFQFFNSLRYKNFTDFTNLIELTHQSQYVYKADNDNYILKTPLSQSEVSKIGRLQLVKLFDLAKKFHKDPLENQGKALACIATLKKFVEVHADRIKRSLLSQLIEKIYNWLQNRGWISTEQYANKILFQYTNRCLSMPVRSPNSTSTLTTPIKASNPDPNPIVSKKDPEIIPIVPNIVTDPIAEIVSIQPRKSEAEVRASVRSEISEYLKKHYEYINTYYSSEHNRLIFKIFICIRLDDKSQLIIDHRTTGIQLYKTIKEQTLKHRSMHTGIRTDFFRIKLRPVEDQLKEDNLLLKAAGDEAARYLAKAFTTTYSGNQADGFLVTGIEGKAFVETYEISDKGSEKISSIVLPLCQSQSQTRASIISKLIEWGRCNFECINTENTSNPIPKMTMRLFLDDQSEIRIGHGTDGLKRNSTRIYTDLYKSINLPFEYRSNNFGYRSDTFQIVLCPVPNQLEKDGLLLKAIGNDICQYLLKAFTTTYSHCRDDGLLDPNIAGKVFLNMYEKIRDGEQKLLFKTESSDINLKYQILEIKSLFDTINDVKKEHKCGMDSLLDGGFEIPLAGPHTILQKRYPFEETLDIPDLGLVKISRFNKLISYELSLDSYEAPSKLPTIDEMIQNEEQIARKIDELHRQMMESITSKTKNLEPLSSRELGKKEPDLVAEVTKYKDQWKKLEEMKRSQDIFTLIPTLTAPDNEINREKLRTAVDYIKDALFEYWSSTTPRGQRISFDGGPAPAILIPETVPLHFRMPIEIDSELKKLIQDRLSTWEFSIDRALPLMEIEIGGGAKLRIRHETESDVHMITILPISSSNKDAQALILAGKIVETLLTEKFTSLGKFKISIAPTVFHRKSPIRAKGDNYWYISTCMERLIAENKDSLLTLPPKLLNTEIEIGTGAKIVITHTYEGPKASDPENKRYDCFTIQKISVPPDNKIILNMLEEAERVVESVLNKLERKKSDSLQFRFL